MIRVHHRAKAPIWALAGASLFWLGPPALAAPEDDLAVIRNELSKLRQDYEMKVKDLEERLQKAEADAEAAKAAAAQAAQVAPSAVADAPPPPAPPLVP